MVDEANTIQRRAMMPKELLRSAQDDTVRYTFPYWGAAENARSAHNCPQAIITHNRKAAVFAFMIRLCRIIAFGSVGGGPRTRNARRRIQKETEIQRDSFRVNQRRGKIHGSYSFVSQFTLHTAHLSFCILNSSFLIPLPLFLF